MTSAADERQMFSCYVSALTGVQKSADEQTWSELN